jgi:hypothetical protein
MVGVLEETVVQVRSLLWPEVVWLEVETCEVALPAELLYLMKARVDSFLQPRVWPKTHFLSHLLISPCLPFTPLCPLRLPQLQN